MKREANFNTIFGKYLVQSKLYCNYELKQTQGNSISWKVFETPRVQRQLHSLVAAMNSGYHWKHSDTDPREKPFDGSYNFPAPSVVGIMFFKYNTFVIIGIGEFLAEKIYSAEKSLTFEKAKQIAFKTVEL